MSRLPIILVDLANYRIGTGMSEAMKMDDLLPLVTEVVSAQLSNNKTASSAVAPLIQSVYQVLDELRAKGTPAELPSPAVPIKKSVTPDYLVCLEDGKQLKMLKRYLRNAHGMTPDEYRKRWGLPADYPMVAPRYAEKRSKIAKSLGLGTTRRRKRVKR
jgi:predicted transcriptional regulator